LRSRCICRDLSEEKHNEDLVTDSKAHASIQRDPAKQGKLNKDEDLIAINIVITPYGSIDIQNSLFCFVSICCLSIMSICLCNSLGCMCRTKLETKKERKKIKSKDAKLSISADSGFHFGPYLALISAYSLPIFLAFVVLFKTYAHFSL
jgi:hypothetical protein